MVRLIKVAVDAERDNGSVVFIHGLGADPITTWGGVTERRPGNLFWPAWIAEAFPEYAVYSISYEAPPTDWHGEAQPLLNIGRSVLGLLLSDEELIKRPIAFVCHSLGGLIVKQLIRFAFERRRSDPKARRLYERVGQVVFFGTPHKGSGFANAVGMFRRALRPSALTDTLKINNESQLIELNDWYVGLPKNEGHHIQHLIFQETRGVGIPGFRALVVPPESADPGIADARIIDVAGADHFEICRPTQKDALVLREIIQFLGGLSRAQPLPASETSRYFEEFRSYYLKGEDGAPVPFGGRDGELAELDAWLDTPSADRRLLISAEAGLGKSALVMKWIESLEQRKQVNAPGKPRLVFIAISNRFSTNAPITYLSKLSRELAYIANEPSPDSDTSEANLRGRINQLLGRLEAKDEPLLIVVDGLDEALIPEGEGVETLKGLIPKPFPGNLRLLVSARWIVGDNDGNNWRNRLDWSASDQSRDITVRPLDECGVGEVLKLMGAPLNLDAEGKDRQIVRRISELTEGEPLLIRYYAEDLWGKAKAGSPITLETLGSVEKGFAGYFKKWIEQYQGGPVSAAITGIDQRTVEPALAVFGFAAGPLFGYEFLDVCKIGFSKLPWEESSRKHVRPFLRFLIGDGVNRPYALSHPKVGQYLQEDRCKELKDRVERTFYEWGKRHITQLNSTASDRLRPEMASPYLLSHYAYHLKLMKDAASSADYMEMVEDGWRQAKEYFDGGSQSGFAHDVKAAWDAIRVDDGGLGRLGDQWRCALTLSSIKSLGINIPGPLLVELVKDRTLSSQHARHYAELKGPTVESVDALARMAVAIADNPRAAAEIASAAIELALKSPDAELQATALAKALDSLQIRGGKTDGLMLAPHLDPAQRRAALAEALAAAKAIGSEYDRARALAALAPHLDPAQRAEALAAAKAIGYENDRAQALAALAPHLDPAQRAEALAAAKAIGSEYDRAQALAALAPHLDPAQRAEALAEALAATKAIGSENDRAQALAALAPHLDPAQRAEALAEALAATKAIGSEYARAQALAALAPHLDPAQRAEALAAAKAIGDENARAQALAALAPHLDAAQRAEALAAAKAIGYELYRAQALAALAPHLDAAQRAEALAAAKAIGSENDRARALAALAPHLDPAQRAEALAEALAATKAIGSEYARAQALAALAPHLDPAQRAEALAEALAATKAIGSEYARAQALAALAPHLDAAQRAEALAAAKAISYEIYRAQALAALAPHLDPAQRAEALAATKAIGSEYDRAQALAALAPHLDPAQRAEALAEALAAAKAIGDENARAQALAALAPHLDPAQRAEALAAAKAIGSENDRARALAALAPHLDPAQRAEALAATKAIGSEYARAQALAALAPHLDPAQRAEALAAAKAISYELYRARALAALAPHLDPAQRAEALAATKAIGSENDRAQALAVLAKHVSGGEGRELMIALLDSASNIARDSALFVVCEAFPLIVKLGGPSAASQLRQAISDVCRWYP